jgi:hypothetical protein
MTSGGPKSSTQRAEAPSSGIRKPSYSAGGKLTYMGSIRPHRGPGTMRVGSSFASIPPTE